MRPRLSTLNARRRQWSAAFAGPEFVAVLAVLGLVAALVLVPLQRARHRAGVAQCTENLRQLAAAVQLYATDHQATLPGPVAGQKGDYWWWYKEQVRPYVGRGATAPVPEGVWACPGDRGYSDPGPFWRNPRFDNTSYVFNGVTLPGMPNVAGWSQGAVVEPHRTLLVMEWTAHAPLSWHRSRTGPRNLPFYNNAESAVAFADGHAAFIPIYYDGYNAAYTRDPIAGYEYRYSGR